MTSVLSVHLQKAVDLKKVTSLGAQQVYVKLICTEEKSAIAKTKGTSPEFNQTFEFVNVTDEHTLTMEFWTRGIIVDKLLGGFKIPVSKAGSSGQAVVLDECVISKSGKHRGNAFFTLTLRKGAATVPPPKSSTPPPKPIAIVQPGPSAAPLPPPSPAGISPQQLAKGAWILPTYAGKSVWQHYTKVRQLGKGTFGTTYLATHKDTRAELAVKVISKLKLTCREEIEDVQHEVQIMHHLAGHPNVVALKEVFEDKDSVSIVMEVCKGGELFETIVARGVYSERDAAAVMRSIVSVIAHCHIMGVVHRDLKPENFLLSDKSPTSVIKATDFGLSCFYQDGKPMADIVGSPYYVAPEVLRKSYGKHCDIWSCGVILYILLSGYPPFIGDNERAIFKEVLTKPLDLTSSPWDKISEPAKDCVKRMLTRDPTKRATAADVLKHEWMRENGVATSAPIQNEVLTRMGKFAAMNRFKKQALKMLAMNLPMEELEGMKQLFKSIDTDGSGSLSIEEFARALRRHGTRFSEEQLQLLMADADVNKDGTIDWEEFVGAMMNMGKIERGAQLKQVFEKFDTDGSGSISTDELRRGLAELAVSESEVSEIMKEVDRDGNGVIDYVEFCTMMRKL